MYLIFLIILMAIFTVCISLIIINGKHKAVNCDKLTDDVDFIDKDFSKDDEII